MSVPESVVDPRVEKTHEAVRAATFELLAEVGLHGLTMEGIAARAGIGRSTLYRHWDNPLSIVHDAIVARPGPTDEQRSHDDPIDDITGILTHLVEAMSDPHRSSMASALAHASELDSTVAGAFRADNDRRRARLEAAIARATTEGRLDPATDASVAATALAGAVVYARAMTPTPLTPADVPGLMQQVLGTPDQDQDQPSR